MKILLAIDGSTASQSAVDEIARRPWPASSVLRIISVVSPHDPGGGDSLTAAATSVELMGDHDADPRLIATRAADRLRRPGMPVEVVTRQGNPASTIVEEAAEWNADLIVLGSYGRTGLKVLLLGSVARAVVTHAPCSVEVVRHRRQAA
jgi:nucleotide-binding universal stress UspA family protein